MSPRPRLASDADVLSATQRVIAQIGPSRFTLADVASEAGLAPATLVQRFGSKRGLLLAVAAQATGSVNQCFTQARASHRSPLAALFSCFQEMTRHVATPEAMANSLAFLQIDLTDPDFHRLALENSQAIVAGYRALLDEAVAARELVPCDTSRLARAVQATSNGSMLSWAIHREGSLAGWLRHDSETLLAPYRTPQAGRKIVPPRSKPHK